MLSLDIYILNLLEQVIMHLKQSLFAGWIHLAENFYLVCEGLRLFYHLYLSRLYTSF